MRYYSTQRPVSIGTYPKGNVQKIVNFNGRRMVPEIRRQAWGYIEYEEALPDDLAEEYELVPMKEA